MVLVVHEPRFKNRAAFAQREPLEPRPSTSRVAVPEVVKRLRTLRPWETPGPTTLEGALERYAALLTRCGLLNPRASISWQILPGLDSQATSLPGRGWIFFKPRQSKALSESAGLDALHELIHLAGHAPGHLGYGLAEATTVLLAAGIHHRVHPWPDAGRAEVMLERRGYMRMPTVYAVPALYALVRTRAGERRTLPEWLVAVQRADPRTLVKLRLQVSESLTSAERASLRDGQAFFTAHEDRQAEHAEGSHNGCGHSLVDRLLVVLGFDYHRLGVERDPRLAGIRALLGPLPTSIGGSAVREHLGLVVKHLFEPRQLTSELRERAWPGPASRGQRAA